MPSELFSFTRPCPLVTMSFETWGPQRRSLLPHAAAGATALQSAWSHDLIPRSSFNKILFNCSFLAYIGPCSDRFDRIVLFQVKFIFSENLAVFLYNCWLKIIIFLCFIREASLFLGWGGATSSGNPYNSRESPYLRKRSFTCPFILPKDSKKSKVENFSPPLRDALKIFRPPFATRWKIFAPPST